MAIPSLILTPHEARNRYGIVTPELSSGVELRGDAWRLLEGTTNFIPRPLLDEGWSSPRIPEDGTITLHRDSGTAPEDIPTTLRWEIQAGGATGTAGRFLLSDQPVEGLNGAPILTQSVWVRTSTDALVPMMYTDVRRKTSSGNAIVGTMVTATGSAAVEKVGEWYRVTFTKDDWRDGMPDNATFYLGVYPNVAGASGTVEFAGPQLEPKDHATPFTVGTRDQGAILVPHPQPIGDLLVRYREGGTVKTERMYGPGRFGLHGIVNYGGGYLEVTTDREIELLGLIAYPAEAVLTGAGTRASRVGNITVSGGVTERDGALLLLEGTTNDVRDPLWETMDGWSIQADAWSEHGIDPDLTHNGNPVYRLVSGRENASSIWLQANTEPGTYSSGDPVAMRVLVMADKPGVEFRVNAFARDSAYSLIDSVALTKSVGPDEWTEFVVTRDNLPDGTGRVTHFMYALNPDVGTTYWITEPQVEKKTYATPFTVGTRPDGVITVPLTREPRRITLRYREDDAIYTDELTGPGSFGSYGRVELDGTTLTITTDRQTELLAVVVDPELEGGEAEKLLQTNVWRWNTAVPSPAGVLTRDVEVPIVIIPGRVRHG